MLDFLKCFLGQGDTVEFTNFSLAHFLPILFAAGIIFLIRFFREKLRGMKREHLFRYLLAFALICSEMSYYWRLIAVPALDPNPADHLPVTVCGWVAVFASFMVLCKSQTLFDICYFWAFSGTIFALITPTVITYTGPTRFRYYQFWAEHLLGYIAIFYMIFVHKMRPNVKSVFKAHGAMVVLAVIACWANSLIGPGANYLFLAKPEDTPSILDILPSNFAVRILIMASAVSTLFLLAYLPWFLMDRRKQKAAV